MGVKRLSRSDAAIAAALALAAHYFPDKDEDGRIVASFEHAAFLLSGHADKWPRWREITHDERRRIAAVLALAPVDLASPKVFAARARILLALPDGDPGQTPWSPAGDRPAKASAAVGRVGGDYLGYADRILDRAAKDHRRSKPQAVATPGMWMTGKVWEPGKGMIQGRATIPATALFTGRDDDAVHDLPEVTTVPYREEVPPGTGELLDLAARIDLRYEPKDRYLHSVLAGLFAQLNTVDTVDVAEAIRMSAGPLEVFNAPTGTGKSVLVRVAASWFALNNLNLMIVLPSVEATLSAAWDIRGDLAHLGMPGACSPLMSPNGLRERAMKMATRVEGPLLGQSAKEAWKLDQLSYGCALNHFIEAARPYPPGRESCRSLSPLPPAYGRRVCPYMPTCGKYAQQYEACTTPVVVTNHHNFLLGRLHISVLLDGRATGGLPVAEFGLRRSHAVMIDEVDQFQSTAVDLCASDLVLSSRKDRPVPLRELDAEKDRLGTDAVKNLVPTVSHARYLAEFLLAAICEGQIHLRHYEGGGPARERPGMNSSEWHLAGSRDRRLLTLLFGEAAVAHDAEIPAELRTLLDALRPSPPFDDGETSGEIESVDLPPFLEEVREALAGLLAPRGEDVLASAKLDMDDALKGVVKDLHDRAEAVELLIVRTWLSELDHALSTLRSKTAQLRSTGLVSANKLAEILEGGVAGDIIPFGMLGRAVFGYRVTGLDDPSKSAELTSQNIAGDPHTYTAQLGSIVSLALAGVERPVMGLSATAYFPQAVREHIHGPVKWWMTDAAPDSIRARQQTVTNALNQPIKISGIPQALKRRVLIDMGERLYDTKMHAELARLEAADRDRAHAAVVVNSYEHCRYIALGIHGSSQYRGGLCVAVPTDKARRDSLPPLPAGVVELTPEEFTTFPDRGRILVVPMARIARGLNIVVNMKSAITPVYLCTRPLALLTDPAEMYGSVNAAGLAAWAVAGTGDPVMALKAAQRAAWERLGLIMRSAPGFIATHKDLQEEIVAGMIIDMIQLAGRARRGGTDMTLHLVDYSFHEDAWQSDLAHILGRMHAKWTPDVRRQMNTIYREALAAFLAYAGIETPAR